MSKPIRYYWYNMAASGGNFGGVEGGRAPLACAPVHKFGSHIIYTKWRLSETKGLSRPITKTELRSWGFINLFRNRFHDDLMKFNQS